MLKRAQLRESDITERLATVEEDVDQDPLGRVI